MENYMQCIATCLDVHLAGLATAGAQGSMAHGKDATGLLEIQFLTARGLVSPARHGL